MNTVKVLTLEYNDLPTKLQGIPTAPKKLYYRGNKPEYLGTSPSVAIVGSRKVDEYGRYITKKFASELSQKGITIISGLALGVDALAHTACLEEGGTTLAVLPSGIESIYPRTHAQLGKRIESSGGLLSEYPDRHTPYPGNFLERNRLISGLADVVIVTQAAAKSGSLNTAMHARKQGKIVLAVPGPITNPLCDGTNMLIKNGAVPLISSDQVLKLLKIKKTLKKIDTSNYTALETEILKNIKGSMTTTDDIIRSTQQNTELIITTLTMLEIKGNITLIRDHWTMI